MGNNKLSVAEDRLINGWNPPQKGKLQYILASLGPTALAVGLSMGPGSIGSALQLGALTGYRMLWVMIIIALAMAVESYITNFVIYASHGEGRRLPRSFSCFENIWEYLLPLSLQCRGCCVLLCDSEPGDTGGKHCS